MPHWIWYDDWCPLGTLIDVTGPRGIIDLGISSNDTIDLVLATHWRIRHRIDSLNRIVEAIEAIRLWRQLAMGDVVLWRSKAGKYAKKFSTHDTWHQLRTVKDRVAWYRRIWFKFATLKYSFTA